jgi:hypothetical protein
MNQSGECPVCLEKRLFMDQRFACEHKVCGECVLNLRKCPLCRCTLFRPFQVFVKWVAEDRTFVLDVHPSDTVNQLKEQMQGKTGIPVDQIRLIFRGEPLSGDLQLQNRHDLFPESTLHMILQLRGDIGLYQEEEDEEELLDRMEDIGRYQDGYQGHNVSPFETQRGIQVSDTFPTPEVEPWLTVDQCDSLMRLLDAWIRDGKTDSDSTTHDIKVTLFPQEFSSLFPEQDWKDRLSTVSRVRLRRVKPNSTRLWIPWHQDYTKETVTVPLNTGYCGGFFYFQNSGGHTRRITRFPGVAMKHNQTMPHCVTPLVSGVKYTLFFLSE